MNASPAERAPPLWALPLALVAVAGLLSVYLPGYRQMLARRDRPLHAGQAALAGVARAEVVAVGDSLLLAGIDAEQMTAARPGWITVARAGIDWDARGVLAGVVERSPRLLLVESNLLFHPPEAPGALTYLRELFVYTRRHLLGETRVDAGLELDQARAGSYRGLRREMRAELARANARGTRVVVVVFPVLAGEPAVHAAELDRLDGVTVWRFPGARARRDFSDGRHLTAGGRQRFTTWLIAQLAELERG